MVVPTGANVTYVASGSRITLDPGFRTELGAHFRAVFPDELQLLSASNPTGTVGQFNTNPFDVAVGDSSATVQPLPGAFVTFTVVAGGGKLAFSKNGTPTLYTTLTALADQAGTVRVYYQHSSASQVASTIQVTAGLASLSLLTTSQGAPSDLNGNGIPDVLELRYFGNTSVDPLGDADNDGMLNRDEMLAGRDPTKRLDAFPLPANVQLVLQTPVSFFGVSTSTWSVTSLPTP